MASSSLLALCACASGEFAGLSPYGQAADAPERIATRSIEASPAQPSRRQPDAARDIADLEVKERAEYLERLVEDGALTGRSKALAVDGLTALNEGELDEALAYFNAALKIDVTNPTIQFLTGLTYHVRSRQGWASEYDLAETGYRIAARFDPTNWTPHYYQGLLKLHQRQYEGALGHFVKAGTLNRHEPKVFYHLAAAAYYSGEIETSLTALKRLQALVDTGTGPTGDAPDKTRLLDALAVVSAAAGQIDDAEKYRDAFSREHGAPERVAYLTQRIEDWASAHATFGDETAGARVENAQFVTAEEPAAPGGDTAFGAGFAGDSAADAARQAQERKDESFFENAMVVVDVTIIGVEEDNTTSTGVNLLNGLRLQFGDPLTSSPAFAFARSIVDDDKSASVRSDRTTITNLIGLSDVTYSLNIANVGDSKNEVLARPTLASLSGETAEFFSGVEVSGAATSGGDGNSVAIEKEIGVALSVTPELIDRDSVRLNIIAERTFLTQPSKSVLFDFRLDTTKTKVSAPVSMKFGQTLILSGLSERAIEKDADGVPYVKDVPVANLLFSNKSSRDYRKSVIILVTPRRSLPLNADLAEAAEARRLWSDREIALERLWRQKLGDLQPTTNLGSVVSHLRDKQLFEEFRTLDFPPEGIGMNYWGEMGQIIDHLKY